MIDENIDHPNNLQAVLEWSPVPATPMLSHGGALAIAHTGAQAGIEAGKLIPMPDWHFFTRLPLWACGINL